MSPKISVIVRRSTHTSVFPACIIHSQFQNDNINTATVPTPVNMYLRHSGLVEEFVFDHLRHQAMDDFNRVLAPVNRENQ